MFNNEYFQISPEVLNAIENKKPVVVMESTVWLHGLPEDFAIPAMKESREAAASEGAVGAVTLIQDGKVKIGVSVDEIEKVLEEKSSYKVNVRDIPAFLQRHETGATTVSATLFCAASLGLPVAATGGIGGVHRDAGKSFDVSADLQALARYPVALTASGVKSVLDIGATLEMMETLGIPVLGYKTDFFPAFYTSSAFPIPQRVDSPEEISGIVRANLGIHMDRGILVANPIPADDAMNEIEVERATCEALRLAEEDGIKGKDVTPFLLEKIHEITGGDTVRANLALLRDNALLAAKISRKISESL